MLNILKRSSLFHPLEASIFRPFAKPQIVLAKGFASGRPEGSETSLNTNFSKIVFHVPEATCVITPVPSVRQLLKE